MKKNKALADISWPLSLEAVPVVAVECRSLAHYLKVGQQAGTCPSRTIGNTLILPECALSVFDITKDSATIVPVYIVSNLHMEVQAALRAYHNHARRNGRSAYYQFTPLKKGKSDEGGALVVTDIVTVTVAHEVYNLMRENLRRKPLTREDDIRKAIWKANRACHERRDVAF